MVEISQKVYYRELIIEVKDNEYHAELSVFTGSFLPFDVISAYNGKESFILSLTEGKYGYFIKYNNTTYFIRFKDFQFSTDQIVDQMKKGYEEFRKFIMEILKKGKVINKTK